MVKFLAYFTFMFIITLVFSGMNVFIWWAAQHGFWWAMAALAFSVAVVGAVILSFKDPAKVSKPQ